MCSLCDLRYSHPTPKKGERAPIVYIGQVGSEALEVKLLWGLHLLMTKRLQLHVDRSPSQLLIST